jgi:hypothetical protein
MGGIDTGGGVRRAAATIFDVVEVAVYGFAGAAGRTETLPKQREESILD